MFRQDFHGIAPKLLKEAKLQALDIMVKLALKVAQDFAWELLHVELNASA